jgi:hypothetical protein
MPKPVFVHSKASLESMLKAIRGIPDTDDVTARFFSPRERSLPCPRTRATAPSYDSLIAGRARKPSSSRFETSFQPLDRFDVSLAPGELALILRGGTRPGDHCGRVVHSFLPGPGLIHAIVMRKVPTSWVQGRGPERNVVHSLSHH